MTPRYPRPFKFRRQPAAAPILKDRTFEFEFDPMHTSFGPGTEYEAMCQNLFGRVIPWRNVREILSTAALRDKVGILSARVIESNYSCTICVSVTKRARISPKLAATFPRLKLPKP